MRLKLGRTPMCFRKGVYYLRKRLVSLLFLAVVLLLLVACAGMEDNSTSVPPASTTAVIDPDNTHSENEAPAGNEPSEYPWMAPEVEHLSYEEFFAEEREYQDREAPGYMYWTVDAGDGSYTAYVLTADENGFCISEHRNETNVSWRLVLCSQSR